MSRSSSWLSRRSPSHVAKRIAEQVVAIVFVYQPHDTVHIKIDRAVGVAGQEKRLEAVGPAAAHT